MTENDVSKRSDAIILLSFFVGGEDPKNFWSPATGLNKPKKNVNSSAPKDLT